MRQYEGMFRRLFKKKRYRKSVRLQTQYKQHKMHTRRWRMISWSWSQQWWRFVCVLWGEWCIKVEYRETCRIREKVITVSSVCQWFIFLFVLVGSFFMRLRNKWARQTTDMRWQLKHRHANVVRQIKKKHALGCYTVFATNRQTIILHFFFFYLFFFKLKQK